MIVWFPNELLFDKTLIQYAYQKKKKKTIWVVYDEKWHNHPLGNWQ